MDELLGKLSDIKYHIWKNGQVYEIKIPVKRDTQLGGRNGYTYTFPFEDISNEIHQHKYKTIYISRSIYKTIPKNENGSIIFQVSAGRKLYEIIDDNQSEAGFNSLNYKSLLFKENINKQEIRLAILDYITKRYDELHTEHFLIYEIVTALKFNYKTILNQIDRFIRDEVLDFNYNMHPLDTLPEEEQITHRVTKGPKFDKQLNQFNKFRNITTQIDSGKNNEPNNYEYDIALSFAGENRNIAEELANGLIEKNVRVFYDAYEKANLWGKDLYQHLQKVYRDRARYCIIFVSAAYAEKIWTRHELKQAQARAFMENQEYILPVRLDDTEIPGLNATVGYIDLRNHTIEELKEITLKKLGV